MAGSKIATNPLGAYSGGLPALGIEWTVESVDAVADGTIAAGDAVTLAITQTNAATYAAVANPAEITVTSTLAADSSAAVFGIALDAATEGQTLRVVVKGFAIAHAANHTIAQFDLLAAGANAATTGTGTLATATAVTSGLCIAVALNAFTANQYGWVYVNKM